MYLYINTASHEKIVLALLNKQGEILKLKKIKAVYQQSEKLLNSISTLLGAGFHAHRQAGTTCTQLKRLQGIIVVIGPGSFTSLRIGAATANTLAWSLNIPILGIENKSDLDDEVFIDKNFKKILNKTKFSQVLPKYGKEPNITVNK